MSFFNFIIWIFGIVYKFVVGLFSSSKPTTDHESLQTDRYVFISITRCHNYSQKYFITFVTTFSEV